MAIMSVLEQEQEQTVGQYNKQMKKKNHRMMNNKKRMSLQPLHPPELPKSDSVDNINDDVVVNMNNNNHNNLSNERPTILTKQQQQRQQQPQTPITPTSPNSCKQKFFLKKRGPNDSNKITLVLDLDETLISAQLHAPKLSANLYSSSAATTSTTTTVVPATAATTPRTTPPSPYYRAGVDMPPDEEDENRSSSKNLKNHDLVQQRQHKPISSAVASVAEEDMSLDGIPPAPIPHIDSFQTEFTTEYGITETVTVYKRPHLYQFLKTVSQWFEVVLFTSSIKQYADSILDQLEKEASVTIISSPKKQRKVQNSGPIFSERLYREHCTRVEPMFCMDLFQSSCVIKDLARLGRDVNRTIIIDNTPNAYKWHKKNAMPVSTWTHTDEDCASDTELSQLLPYLHQIYVSNDIKQPLEEYRAQFTRNDLFEDSVESTGCCVIS